jgi:hypothetical protein
MIVITLISMGILFCFWKSAPHPVSLTKDCLPE